jgi:6-phosphofructokinase 1
MSRLHHQRDASNPWIVQVNLLTSAGLLLTAVAASAYISYTITKDREETKVKQIAYRQYQREQLLKLKTAEARQKTSEPPSGKLLEDVKVDRVYLWECEDLRKRFPSANTLNTMKFKAALQSTIRSMRSSESNPSLNNLDVDESTRITQYNKLITDHECILAEVVRKPNAPSHTVGYMRAGPRRTLHFNPATVNAAIVTCGGLCPGLNSVIREITKTLHQIYGIQGKVYGIQGGFSGFHEEQPQLKPLILTPEVVENIQHQGGTILGSSRGGYDLEKIIKFLKKHNVNQLYVIGGDGTHRGAFGIHEGCMERGMNVAVAGIPKTIDNDVDYIDHSFGFASAVEAAQTAIRSAKTEAVCNLPNGIGIVKLMGRSAGFLAAHATMSSSEVDLCLVPEVPIVLEGENGCLPHLRRRVQQQGYAVVVVAEGAGEELLGTSADKDASGNKKLPAIGEFMKKAIQDYFVSFGEEATVKYIDPSYTVRSIAANAADSLYCMQLAQNAVHGAMAGYTGFSVGLCNNRLVYLPIPELVSTSPRSMNPHGRTWERVLALTRQPNTVPPPAEASRTLIDNNGEPVLY